MTHLNPERTSKDKDLARYKSQRRQQQAKSDNPQRGLPTPERQTPGLKNQNNPPHKKRKVDIIMAYIGKTAGKKTTKQLDGMNAGELQALATEMSRKMKKLGESPGEPKEWRKRLHHIHWAIKDRTLMMKPGDSAMENLKKRLARTKVMPTNTKKKASKTNATNREPNQPASHAQVRMDTSAKQRQHDDGDMQCNTCDECDDCYKCHQCLSCYSFHECPMIKNGQPHQCTNL